MKDWMNSSREELKKTLRRPLPDEAMAACEEMQHRLEDMAHHDPIVNAALNKFRSLRYHGVELRREHLYALMAYHLLDAKIRVEEIALDGLNSMPAKPFTPESNR